MKCFIKKIIIISWQHSMSCIFCQKLFVSECLYKTRFSKINYIAHWSAMTINYIFIIHVLGPIEQCHQHWNDCFHLFPLPCDHDKIKKKKTPWFILAPCGKQLMLSRCTSMETEPLFPHSSHTSGRNAGHDSPGEQLGDALSKQTWIWWYFKRW